MASGDLTASAPVLCKTSAAIVTAVAALNLAISNTDVCHIIPTNDLDNGWWVFKVTRAV